MADGSITIESATLGYSKEGLDSFMKKIHTNVIGEATKRIKQAGTQLKQELAPVWKGKSAEIYKSNLDTDFQTLVTAMEATELLLNAELIRIVTEMSNMDQKLMRPHA